MSAPLTASWVLAGAAFVALAGCNSGNAAAAEEELREQLVELGREITDLIGAAACEGNEQCRLIALGHKPCGGPAAYRAYSTLGADTALLETRVPEYNRLAEQYNRKTNAISDCAILLAPMVQCVEGQCRTVAE